MSFSVIAMQRWVAALCGAAALTVSAAALADPPDRVARLTQLQGAVTFSPAGEEDWVNAEPNRPLTTGDQVWSDAGSHVELQIGTAQARLGENTSVAILNLDDRVGQFQLAQGTLNLRVRRIEGDQFYEIDTPTLAFSVRSEGNYRIDVDPSGNTTVIQVRDGEGDAWGEGTAYTIDAGQQYTFEQGFQNVQYDALPPPDAFDQWTIARDRREDSVASARYVSPDVIGYSDLDEYGTWRDVQGYGNVWVPTRVDTGWAPYQYGRWAWVEPWGWTWIDDQPWGFAPFHYGRWAYLSSRWCWVPGPVAVRTVYSPALVAFVGGNGFSISVGGGPVTGVAWFPLGVGDVYRPPYQVSQTYFTNINITNTVINRTYVTQAWNNPSMEVRYRNRDVVNAVTAVPTNVFASGERVERHVVRVPRDVAERQPVTPVAAIAPTRAAVIAAGAATAGAAAASHRPPREALNRQVVARTQPPPPKPSFEATSRQLASQPGRPLAPQEMQRLRSERPTNERAAEAPKVKVVSPNVTPRAPERATAKGGPAATPPNAQGRPGAPTAQEERARERRQGQQAGEVPQPPAAAQERMREQQQRGQAQGAPTPPAARGGPAGQEQRAAGETRRGERVPQPPAQAQERMKGGPGGQAAQQEQAQRAQQERAQQERAQQGQAQRAQQERAAQERAQQQKAQQDRAAQERAQQQRGQQEQAQRAQQERAQQEQTQRAQQERSQQQRAEQQRAAQERAQQQRAQQEQAQRAQQERSQQQRAEQQRAAQERSQQQRAQQQQAAQERAQQRAQQQQAAQERAQQQRAQQQQAAQERAQAQRAQQERAQQQQAQHAQQQQAQRAQQEAAAQQRAQQQAPQERAQQERQRGQEKEKEKEKERPAQQ